MIFPLGKLRIGKPGDWSYTPSSPSTLTWRFPSWRAREEGGQARTRNRIRITETTAYFIALQSTSTHTRRICDAIFDDSHVVGFRNGIFERMRRRKGGY